MPETIPRGMDDLQTHTNPTFQPFNFEDDGYSSSDSSLASSNGSLSSHAILGHSHHASYGDNGY